MNELDALANSLKEVPPEKRIDASSKCTKSTIKVASKKYKASKITPHVTKGLYFNGTDNVHITFGKIENISKIDAEYSIVINETEYVLNNNTKNQHLKPGQIISAVVSDKKILAYKLGPYFGHISFIFTDKSGLKAYEIALVA